MREGRDRVSNFALRLLQPFIRCILDLVYIGPPPVSHGRTADSYGLVPPPPGWFFNIFKIGPRPSKVTSGRPKTPPGPHFFLRAAEGRPSGRPKSLSAPPGIPFGAQGGANGPPGASKRRPFQVKVFKKRYCFPCLLQTLFFGNVSLAPTGNNISFSKI